MGRFDIHAHLLPAVDDGPSSFEDAVAMARIAASDGTETILATPHQRDVAMKSSVDDIRQSLNKLNDAVYAGIPSGTRPIRILLGMENHIEPDLVEWVSEGRAITMNETKFILSEPPFTAYPPYVEETLFRLQITGLVPVIAHPERNSTLQQNPKRLRELIERGMLTQITAGSFLGLFGADAKRAAETFLASGLVHMVASDMHRPTGPRTPHLTEAHKRVATLSGEETARRIFEETPSMILQNHDPLVEPPLENPRRKWWFQRGN
jgi:protein-tyrosine phosphatase